MGMEVGRAAAEDEARMKQIFEAESCPHPRVWSGGSGEQYEWHAHPYHKVLFCISGSITFRDREWLNYHVHPGDRLDIEGGTEHEAVAGPEGVTCMESYK